MTRHRRQMITVKDAHGDTIYVWATVEFPMSPELRAALEQLALAAREQMRVAIIRTPFTITEAKP